MPDEMSVLTTELTADEQPTREQARIKAACALDRARQIVDSSSPVNSDHDANLVNSLVSIAAEWRYLAEEL